jgi:hypothetical protein
MNDKRIVLQIYQLFRYRTCIPCWPLICYIFDHEMICTKIRVIQNNKYNDQGKRQNERQCSTKHSTGNFRLTNTNATKILWILNNVSIYLIIFQMRDIKPFLRYSYFQLYEIDHVRSYLKWKYSNRFKAVE